MATNANDGLPETVTLTLMGERALRKVRETNRYFGLSPAPPSCPRWLRGMENGWFRRLRRMLNDAGVLTPADMPLLAALAATLETYDRLTAQLKAMTPNERAADPSTARDRRRELRSAARQARSFRLRIVGYEPTKGRAARYRKTRLYRPA